MTSVSSSAAALSASLRESYPESAGGVELGFRSVEDAILGDVRPQLRLLLGAVVLVLLVAAINVGGLLLARLSDSGRAIQQVRFQVYLKERGTTRKLEPEIL